ncbi:MAG: acyltransferase [Proteobacteria bacterium]|nr:acyltransferase [Pseudomonadota bacterium]
MGFERATLTTDELALAMEQAGRRPHKNVHKGQFVLSPEVFTSPGRETNLCLSRFAFCDLTGNIHLGPWCMLGARCRVYTHDHAHLSRRPLLTVQEEHGVLWQDKYIGADVWIHDGAMVLYQATEIPNGVVVAAGAVLTKNPGPYEIWAGVPAKKIGERRPMAPDDLARNLEKRKRFVLADYLAARGETPAD